MAPRQTGGGRESKGAGQSTNLVAHDKVSGATTRGTRTGLGGMGGRRPGASPSRHAQGQHVASPNPSCDYTEAGRCTLAQLSPSNPCSIQQPTQQSLTAGGKRASDYSVQPWGF